MKAFRVIVWYVLAVLVTSAVVAPFIYNWSQANLIGLDLFSWLERQPFPRYFRRTVMVTALVFLPFFLRKLGVRKWTEIGLSAEVEKTPRFVWGIILGGLCIFILDAINLSVGARQFRPEVDSDLLYKFVLVSILIAGLEETFFRGVVLGQLRKHFGFWTALTLSSLFFSALHFVGNNPPPDTGVVDVDWTTGFVMILYSFEVFVVWDKLLFSFTALFLAGLILGYSYLKKGSLYFCIGVHAGWVFMLKTTGLLTDNTPVQNARPWLYGWGLYDGLIGIVILLVFWAGLALYENRRGNQNRF